MSGKASWLRQELPRLVEAGVIDAEAAQRIDAHYAAQPRRSSRQLGFLIFGVFGAVLLGLGIQLILAHNWEQLSRPLRAAISAILLLLAQGTALWVLLRRPSSVAWREASAAFLGLAFGATLALISQTYQVQEDLGAFLLVWSLLGAPLIFLFDSFVVAALYVIGITGWAGVRVAEDVSAGWCWLFYLPALACLARGVPRTDARLRTAFVALSVAACLPIAMGLTGVHELFQIFVGLLAVFGIWCVGPDLVVRWRPALAGPWTWVFALIGQAGIATLILWMTLDLGRENPLLLELDASDPLQGGGVGAELVSAVLALVLAGVALAFGRPLQALFGMAPLFLVAGWFLARVLESEGFALAWANAWMLCLGASTLASGLRQDSLVRLNGGMLLLAVLLVTRFVDTELSFLARGLGFIAIGLAFLAVNWVWSRRTRRLA